MARKKKDSGQQLKVGDIVVLWSQIGMEGEVLGTGAVERIQPMHGNPDQNMIWVPGFAAHHPEAVERVGAPFELIGKMRVLEGDLSDREDEVEALKKDLASGKEKLESAVKAIDKAVGSLVIVDGNDHLDAKAICKWIKDARAKFNLTAIREEGQKSSPKKADE